MTVLLFVQFFFSETAPFQSVKEPRFMSGKTGFLYFGKGKQQKEKRKLTPFVFTFCVGMVPFGQSTQEGSQH